MGQFLEIKALNPGYLLFYRMGDFYEMFFEDAEIASAALGIVLTKRGRHQGQDIPLCGVPVHAAQDYLKKLISLGHRVAICEQVEDVAEAKKRGSKSVVKRDVVRLVTAGTLTEDALLESRRQIVITCDSFPKEITGMEDRLKTRFGWGLTVAVEPPDLEMRVAILLKKAEQEGADPDQAVAFFIAQQVQSNVRELEGALKRVLAFCRFSGQAVRIESCKEALRDLIAVQSRQVTIDNIQRTVAEYYKIRVADLLSKRRSRSIARPRQVAMALAKELTSHSLPEIGDAFGGRDHTTVLHACRVIKELRESNTRTSEDYSNLLRTLAG